MNLEVHFDVTVNLIGCLRGESSIVGKRGESPSPSPTCLASSCHVRGRYVHVDIIKLKNCE